MKLTYRGIDYKTATNDVPMKNGKAIGKYRGVPIYEHIAVNQ